MVQQQSQPDRAPGEDEVVQARFHLTAARLGQQLEVQARQLEEENPDIDKDELPPEVRCRFANKEAELRERRRLAPHILKEKVWSHIRDLQPYLTTEMLREEAFEYFLEHGVSALHPNRYNQVELYIREEAERSGRSKDDVWASEVLAALAKVDLTEVLDMPLEKGTAWKRFGDRLGEKLPRRTGDSPPPASLEEKGEQWASDSSQEADPEGSPYYEDSRVSRSEAVRARLEVVQQLLQSYQSESLEYQVLREVLEAVPGDEEEEALVHENSLTLNVSALGRRIDGVSRYRIEQAVEKIQTALAKRF